jgi:hypothetical protein
MLEPRTISPRLTSNARRRRGRKSTTRKERRKNVMTISNWHRNRVSVAMRMSPK